MLIRYHSIQTKTQLKGDSKMTTENQEEAIYCFDCNNVVDPMHNFECRQCDNPMCRDCWAKNGKDLCPACLAAQ